MAGKTGCGNEAAAAEWRSPWSPPSQPSTSEEAWNGEEVEDSAEEGEDSAEESQGEEEEVSGKEG